MTPAGTSNELDVQNGWEENTHTHTILYAACTFRPYKSTPVLKLFRTFTGKMTRGLSLRMIFSLLFQDTLLLAELLYRMILFLNDQGFQWLGIFPLEGSVVSSKMISFMRE